MQRESRLVRGGLASRSAAVAASFAADAGLAPPRFSSPPSDSTSDPSLSKLSMYSSIKSS